MLGISLGTRITSVGHQSGNEDSQCWVSVWERGSLVLGISLGTRIASVGHQSGNEDR